MSKPGFEERTKLAERLLPGVIASGPGRGSLDLIDDAYAMADEFLADRKRRAEKEG